MIKRFMASTLAIMLIASTNVVVYAGIDDEKTESSNIIKIEQPLNIDDIKSEKDAKSIVEENTDDDNSWVHMINPKIGKDNAVISDGELVVSVNIDSEEDVYFKLMKVQDSLAEDGDEEELSDEDKFIV